MDPGEIAQDRRAIFEKLRRHQLSQRGSQRLQGDEGSQNMAIDEESPRQRFKSQSQRSLPVYPNLDPTVIAQDRQAIGEKLRRHQQMQKQTSQRQGGYEDEHELHDIPITPEIDPQEKVDNDDDMSDSIDVLRKTLGKDGGGRSSFTRLDALQRSRNEKDSSRRMRRHDSHRTPIIDTTVFDLPQFATEIPTTQSLDKTLFGCLYILLCISLLISYAFFLESCKLMNYGI